MTRAEVQQAARAWLGTPYRHAGRSVRGIDCIGLLVVVARQFGVPHIDHQHYTGWADPQYRLIAEFNAVLDVRPPDEPWDGTLGIFAQQGLPCHTGIFSRKHGQLHLVHATIARRLTIEEPFGSDNPRTAGFLLIRRYGFRDLED